MAKQEFLTTIKINPYEIAKADDVDKGFQSFLDNISLITSLIVSSERDFVIGGNVKKSTGLSVIIEPFIAFCKDTGTLYCKASDTKIDLTIASPMYDRVDVIYVSGDGWDVFQKEKRAQWYVTKNPSTQNDSMAFAEFYKKQSQNITIEVLQGDNNSEVAKNISKGQIKLAEINIRAARELLDDKDIHYVSAIKDGDQNKSWTTDKSSTFYISTVVENINKFYKIHNQDGSLKDGVVGKKNLAISAGDIITSSDFSLGKTLNIMASSNANEYIYPIVGKSKLEFTVLASTKIADVFEIVLEGLVYVWKIFIQSDEALLQTLTHYADESILHLDQELVKKIENEKKERKAADEVEKEERIKAIENEMNARIEADEAETEARIKAIENEQKARELEKKERLEAEKLLKKFTADSINESVPVGSFVFLYDDKEYDEFLKLDGKSFNPEIYPDLFVYWEKNLNFLGKDENEHPYLPAINKYDDSLIGEIVTFIGSEYHYEFLEANGLPFSPNIYSEFYEKYWKKHFSHLGYDSLLGWPLRPKWESTNGIPDNRVYIRALPKDNYEFKYPYIKSRKIK